MYRSFVFGLCAIFLTPLCCWVNANTVAVVCRKSPLLATRKCYLGLTTLQSNIISVTPDLGSRCVKNVDYWLALNGFNSYLTVKNTCSGIFQVVTPLSWTHWGPWGPCNVSCGSGRRVRKRFCSTGRQLDCSTMGTSWMNEICNLGSCPKAQGTHRSPLCGVTPPTDRIFGGQNAKKCQFPWMAMIDNIHSHSKFCGGTIVDRTHILTAAHCVTRFDENLQKLIHLLPKELTVYTGSTTMPIGIKPEAIKGIVKRDVATVVVHELYMDSTLANDIAVITLTKPITYNNCHVAICIPNNKTTVYQASQCATMGWGQTSNSVKDHGSNNLYWTSLKIVSQDTCRYTYGKYFLPKCFCAGKDGHDACAGDSGGPVACKSAGDRYYQYGIVSNGFDTCGIVPSQFTNVQEYLPWLQKHLA